MEECRGAAMNLGTPISDALGRYLDLASDQLKLTASNMANVDTPGYKTKGFDFEQEFARELNAVPGLNDVAGPEISMVDGLVARPDGNNVSMDREGIDLATAQMRFKLGVSLLKDQFSQVLSAIHASDGK
jgi:flagellar basal-body rod protein FlgB